MNADLREMNLPGLLDEMKAAMGDPDDLRVLAVAGALAQFLEDWILPQTVRMCREVGHTWEEIGGALGLSRSQAWQRYHEDEESTELVLIRLERDRRVAEAKADAVRRGASADELALIERAITRELLPSYMRETPGGAE